MNTTRNNCANCGKPLTWEQKKHNWRLCLDCYNKTEISKTENDKKVIIKPKFE